MSWTLAASGKLPGELAHLEQEFVDELHALLSKFGMQFAHFQGPTVDRLSAGAEQAPAAVEEPPAAAPAADPAAEEAPAKATKAAKNAANSTPTDPSAQGG